MKFTAVIITIAAALSSLAAALPKDPSPAVCAVKLCDAEGGIDPCLHHKKLLIRWEKPMCGAYTTLIIHGTSQPLS